MRPFCTACAAQAKLLVYASAQEACLAAVPAARERPLVGLAVSLASGILAGLAGAVCSAPADTVITQLAAGGHGSDWRAALDDVLRGASTTTDKLKALWAGTPQRCVALAVLVTAQFLPGSEKGECFSPFTRERLSGDLSRVCKGVHTLKRVPTRILWDRELISRRGLEEWTRSLTRSIAELTR